MAIIGGFVVGAVVALIFVGVYLRLSKDKRLRERQRYVNPRTIHRLHQIEHDDDEIVRVFWDGDRERSGQ